MTRGIEISFSKNIWRRQRWWVLSRKTTGVKTAANMSDVSNILFAKLSFIQNPFAEREQPDDRTDETIFNSGNIELPCITTLVKITTKIITKTKYKTTERLCLKRILMMRSLIDSISFNINT